MLIVRWTAASGCRRPGGAGTVARGGGRPGPSGGSLAVSQIWPPDHHFAREEHQKEEEDLRNSPEALEGR
jgi:hypothetical protein